MEIWDKWFENGTFTTDWSSRAFPTWNEHLNHLRDKPINILEIGSWEGRGSIFFLNYFPKSTLTCLDIFMIDNSEGRFDKNVAPYSDRLRKIKSRSGPALDMLYTREAASFDLIYVDGSHDRDDTMLDTVLSWRILKDGGIIIWDDYNIFEAMKGHFAHEDQNPKPAIDAFLEWHKDEIEILHLGYQVIGRKIKEAYKASALDPAKP
jgi:predicted O-methyltransferase YrrM